MNSPRGPEKVKETQEWMKQLQQQMAAAQSGGDAEGASA
jgi:hypothetical protein